MKWTGSNIIAGIGFALLFLVFAAGSIIAILFAVPDLSIFGMIAVNERDTQIVYKDTDLVSAFENGNFIIESKNCNVEVIMQKRNNAAEGTIVVNENATGVAFNNFSRTLVEWTETIVDGLPYFKIKVLEPTGLVVQKKPTTVYINLKRPAQYQTKLFNFVLDNGNSNVNFSFSDAVQSSESQLHIGKLYVKSAKSVTLPTYSTMDIQNVIVDSSRTDLNCGALVKGDVVINGSKGDQSFDRINGNVKVAGNNNTFRADTTGNVEYKNTKGSLKIFNCKNLDVVTGTADVSITNANGNVKMLTDKGNLSIGSIISGGLEFTAAISANVVVSNKVDGNVLIKNDGKGSISLRGVEGNVDIDSSKKDAASIFVEFGKLRSPSVKILGYDGNIEVRNIRGLTDIRVRDSGAAGAAGRANITVSFDKFGSYMIDGTHESSYSNVIVAGAYVNPPSNIGKVIVYLNSEWNNFYLTLESAKSAWAYPSGMSPYELKVGPTNVNTINGGESSRLPGLLYVSTPSTFELR